jgi:hypothetical protein
MNSVLDGFCIDINIIGFPKEAPLLVVEDQYIKSTRAKSVRVFIRDKQGNGTQIIDEVKKLLMEKYKWINKMKIISQQWVCAYPAQHQGGCGRRNFFDGYIHRDVNNVRGILSCIIFNDDAQSGGIKIWLNSHDYCKESLYFPGDKCINSHLDYHYKSIVINPRKNAAIIFDGRLLHKSLSHNENYQRVAYSFFLCVNRREIKDTMEYMSDVQYEWVDSDSIKKRTTEDSSKKMTLRSSKTKGLWI